MLTIYIDKLGITHASKEKFLGVCVKYEFDLVNRKLIKDHSMGQVLISNGKAYDVLAKSYFDRIVGTPEKLMSFIKQTNLSKLELAELLRPDVKRFYFDVCGTIERLITVYCSSKEDDHCLESGCPFVEDGICTEACNRDGQFYTKSCSNLWVELFVNPNNRIVVWRS